MSVNKGMLICLVTGNPCAMGIWGCDCETCRKFKGKEAANESLDLIRLINEGMQLVGDYAEYATELENCLDEAIEIIRNNSIEVNDTIENWKNAMKLGRGR